MRISIQIFGIDRTFWKESDDKRRVICNKIVQQLTILMEVLCTHKEHVADETGKFNCVIG